MILQLFFLISSYSISLKAELLTMSYVRHHDFYQLKVEKTNQFCRIKRTGKSNIKKGLRFELCKNLIWSDWVNLPKRKNQKCNNGSLSFSSLKKKVSICLPRGKFTDRATWSYLAFFDRVSILAHRDSKKEKPPFYLTILYKLK